MRNWLSDIWPQLTEKGCVVPLEMADKDKLSAERAKLEEKKRKISHVTEKETSGHTDTSDEVTRDSELFSSKTSFDYLFKIVIVGDAVSIKALLA